MVEFHADDYGLFYGQSKRILEAVDEGCINAVSVIVNGDHLKECMKLLERRDVKVALHLNLSEGRAVSETAMGVLTDEDGIFRLSFPELLLISCNPWIRGKYKKALKEEIGEQIRLLADYSREPLRIDSHEHFHMIPLVFDALMEVIREEKVKLGYIRFPKEKIKCRELGKLRPVNLVKVILLRVCGARNQRKHSDSLRNLKRKEFYGLAHSGEMNLETTIHILRSAPKDCEILFHPGGCYEEGDLRKISLKADRKFFSSDDRNAELNVLKGLKKQLDSSGML